MKKILSLLLVTILLLTTIASVSAQTIYEFNDLCFSFNNTEDGKESMVKVGQTADQAQFVNPENPNEVVSLNIVRGIFSGTEGKDLTSINEEYLKKFIEGASDDETLSKNLSQINNTDIYVQSSYLDYAWTINKNGVVFFLGEKNVAVTVVEESEMIMFRFMISLVRKNDDLYMIAYENLKDDYTDDSTRMEFIQECYFKGEKQEEPQNKDAIKILVDGEYVYPDSEPQIVNDRTLCPIRVVAEKLGYNVEWEASTSSAVITDGKTTLRIKIGENTIEKSGISYDSELGMDVTKTEIITSDVSAQIINDRTYLPLRAVGEALGCLVDWDGATRTVIITSK